MELMSSNQLSEKLLLAVKKSEPFEDWVLKLEELTFSKLQNDLSDDDSKKAFWINIYNAFFQILRKVRKVDKPEIYRDKLFTIAGEKFSLDDVEHGVLRRFRWKFSLGYLPNIFTPSLIKKLAVSKVDYRIHFGLNCGAVSCPPIAFYTKDRIEQQLELATGAFLETETDILKNKKEVHVTRLFQWFAGDFGGKSGIRMILKKYLELDSTGYKIVFKEYSWEEELDNYSQFDQIF